MPNPVAVNAEKKGAVFVNLGGFIKNNIEKYVNMRKNIKKCLKIFFSTY